MKIPTVYDEKKILLVDDEPEHLDWLVDYIDSKGFKTTIVTNVKEAIEAAERVSYRAFIIDLNIPFGGWTPPNNFQVGATYDEYHGLHILKFVRTQGNAGVRVLAYLAH